ncbi:MAG: hypothetical protein ACK46C_09115, partial [Flavobacteriales bacterium]
MLIFGQSAASKCLVHLFVHEDLRLSDVILKSGSSIGCVNSPIRYQQAIHERRHTLYHPLIHQLLRR